MGKGTQKPPLIAVDTNVLLDLADENETVWACKETVEKRLTGACFIVLPTVIQELADLAQFGNPLQADLASKALMNLLSWQFQPLNYLPAGHGIVEQIGNKVRDAGIIPEVEKNDSFVLAEAALVGATMLISNDQHLRSIDNFQLKTILDRCDVSTPAIASPWEIAKFFPK